MRSFPFPFRHDRRQFPTKFLQRCNARIQLLQMLFAHIGHATAGSAALLPQTKNLFDFLQRETENLSFLDELNSTERVSRVKPVVRG